MIPTLITSMVHPRDPSTAIVFVCLALAHVVSTNDMYNPSSVPETTQATTTELNVVTETVPDTLVNSLLNEKFISEMQLLERGLVKYRHLLRSNLNTDGDTSPFANSILVEIENNINQTLQSIVELKAEERSYDNYEIKAITLETQLNNLEAILYKLKHIGKTSQQNTRNAIFERNFIQQLHSFSEELENLIEEIKTKKLNKQSQDNVTSDIRQLQSSVNSLQSSVENQRRDQQKEMLRVTDELRNSLYEKIDRKEEDIVGKFHISLENQTQQVLQKIEKIINENVENLKSTFEQKMNETRNEFQMSLDNQTAKTFSLQQNLEGIVSGNLSIKIEHLEHEIEALKEATARKELELAQNKIVQAAKSNKFGEAREILKQVNDSIAVYKHIVSELYNKRKENFDLLLRFAEYIRDVKSQLKVYDSLHTGMIANGHLDAWTLLRLRSSIKKQILYRESKNSEVQSLYDILWIEIERSIPLATSLLNNGSVVNLHNAKCFQCMVDLCEQAIEELADTKLSAVELCSRAQNKLVELDSQIAFHLAIAHLLEQGEEMNSSDAVVLSRYVEEVIQSPDYDKVDLLYRTKYEKLNATLSEMIQKTYVGPIAFAFLNDNSWPQIKNLTDDLDDAGWQCKVYIYDQVVKAVWNNVTISDLVLRAQNNLDSLMEEMNVHEAIINQLKRTGTLNASSATPLQLRMKVIITDEPHYQEASEVYRTKYEELYEMMSSS